EMGVVSIQSLSRRLGSVSSVTVRRDVARLADRGALVRSHGGVSKCEPGPVPVRAALEEVHLPIEEAASIVLPPVEGRGAEPLRLMAQRGRIPFLAESSPQAGGIYLGPDNFAAGFDLGTLAAQRLHGLIAAANVLVISLEALANTRARCEGF